MSAVALGGPGLDRGDVSRWGASFALVLGLHAAALLAVLAHRNVGVEPGEALPAVMIDMAPPPAAPTAAPSEQPPSEAVPEAAIPDPVLDAPPDVPEPDVVPPEPVVTAEVPPLEPPPPVPPVEQIVTPTPVVTETATVSLPPPPKPAPAPTRKVEKKPEAKKPPKPVQARRDQRQEAQRPPSQLAGAQTTSSVPSVSTGSSAASRSSWQGALVSHLRRNLRAQPGETGSASVRFSVDRGGRVLSTSLVGSAGSPSLDAEAIAVFRRSQPLPAPPADVSGQSFTFTIPIRFTVR